MSKLRHLPHEPLATLLWALAVGGAFLLLG
jgi:hypothetical protein